MTQHFYPPTILTNDETHAWWELVIMSNGKLGIMDQYGNVRPLVNAEKFTALKRTPVLGGLMRTIYDLWLQFAHPDGNGGLNAGGLPALEDAREALRVGGFLETNGAPKKEDRATAPLGAGGMEEPK